MRGIILSLLLTIAGTRARAEDAPPEVQHHHGPKVGGHVGLGVPFLTVGTSGTSLIGRDFGTLGLVAGVNVALSAQWSFDFEFIVLADFGAALRTGGVGSAMTFVLDPGVVYNWGPLWTGLRLAMRVPGPLGGAELGFVPIIGKAFKINDKIAYYLELDLPMFVTAPAGFTFTAFVQTGVGF